MATLLKRKIEQQEKDISLLGRAYANMLKKGSTPSKGIIETRIRSLEERWDTIRTRHQEILANYDKLPDAATAMANVPYLGDHEVLERTEETYLDERAKFADALNALNPPPERPPTTPQPQPQGNTATLTTSTRKLPRIDLPRFTGKYSEWASFRDLFESMVSHSDISDVERMQYLKVNVVDEAANFIKNLAVTAENYKRAWDKLKDHYDNNRLVVNSCLNTLFQIKPLSKESAADLKTLSTTTADVVETLESLKRPVEHWSDMLVYVTVQRLDTASLREWETELGDSKDPPTFEQLKTFLKTRIQTLEAIEGRRESLLLVSAQNKSTSHAQGSQSFQKKTNNGKVVAFNTVEVKHNCSCCEQQHFIASCLLFKNMGQTQRKELVTSKRLCFNCLGAHGVKNCRSPKRCGICKGKHHSLLHQESSPQPWLPDSHGETQLSTSIGSHEAQEQAGRTTVGSYTVQISSRHAVLLGTAQIRVTSGERTLVLRALVDPCSEMTFVKESTVQLLRAPRRSTIIPVSGIGGDARHTAKACVTLLIAPRFASKQSWSVEALVLHRLTDYLPPVSSSNTDLAFFGDLMMADPCNTPDQPIDMILGVDIYTHILNSGVIKHPSSNVVAQDTALGWILSGRVQATNERVTVHACTTNEDLLQAIQRFWHQEEITTSQERWSEEELKCEEHYAATTQRDKDGRYIVRLPFRQDPPQLAESYQVARKMMLQMERRFQQNSELFKLYKEFIDEYVALGHASYINPTELSGKPTFYLPHHGVLKRTEEKIKIRVVFNGSVRLDGDNINDCLLPGRKLQTELRDIIQRWRSRRYAWNGDIVKMFRQIRIHPDDQYYLLIVWRDSPSSPLRLLRLNTVTYGLVCAPFQAIRTLQQLAQDEGHISESATQILTEDTYVDDAFGGDDELEGAKQKRLAFSQLLKAGGFDLSKWTANHPELLNPNDADVDAPRAFDFDNEPTHKVLGIKWKPAQDVFVFTVTLEPTDTPVTKRLVASQTARLFDPLGWVAPIVIRFKIFLQSLWHLGMQWDDPLPAHHAQKWHELTSNLKDACELSVPRWINLTSKKQSIELHGFADASEKAMAAVVYLRITSNNSQTSCSILASKTRVAPLKQVSLPRLELNAAAMLVQLVRDQAEILKLKNTPKFLWSDSTVALSWIQGHPTRWATYVANRVSLIQSTVPDATWLHVAGKLNPADIASRGATASDLIEDETWILGPVFLRASLAVWNADRAFTPLIDCPEERTRIHLIRKDNQHEWELLHRYSSLEKLLKITARCLQFITNIKTSLRLTHDHRRTIPTKPNEVKVLTPTDLHLAEIWWVSHIQQVHFKVEMTQISAGKGISKGSALAKLRPYIDQDGLLRVGGRLRHSLLEPDEKHPAILPRDSQFTKLVIWDTHVRLLHGGTQLTLCTLRRKFWIIRGRTVVRSVLFQCLRCWRQKPRVSEQLMGDLPPHRVRPARPFLHSGVDFAGPVDLRLSKGRGTKSYKGYIVVFVCFVSRAVHLEAASDYTAEEFVSVYRRFTARRGICATLTSDCGTNFIGADKKLRDLFNQATATSHHMAQALLKEGTEWKFNPPSAPHFGGLWEAGVKAVKFHLKRVIGSAMLTFEEITTLLAQVEACLNSRPLQPMSDDPTDLGALTPAHFLIGEPLTTIPEPSVLQIPTNRLNRWQLLRHMYEDFWTRWSTEYLQGLQARSKWLSAREPVKVGDLCVVCQESTPPCKWPLGRIEETFPGADGLTRVVRVRTATSNFKRPIVKICLLPTQNKADSSLLDEGGRDV